jgi:hypothetical protein
VIAVDGTGPLPLPRVGILKNPDRLFFDFEGVSSRTFKVHGDDRLVTAVRAALNSIAPKITRVVIDLSEPCRYSLEASQRGSGHIEIALTPLAPGASKGAAPPASRLAPPSSRLAPRASQIAPPASRAPRDAATRRYVSALQSALAQVNVLREVLHDIDARRNPAVDGMATAQKQLSALTRTLNEAKPTASLQGTHDLLKAVVGFASTALSLPANASGEVSPNASSAAAGALLMLQRAEADLAVAR